MTEVPNIEVPKIEDWRHITETDIVRKTREFANGDPDFMYRPLPGGDCQYLRVDEGEFVVPDCAFGHVLLALGVPTEELSHHEGSSIDSVMHKLLGLSEDSVAAKWASVFQQHQDGIDTKGNRIGRKTWGVCLAIADVAFPEAIS